MFRRTLLLILLLTGLLGIMLTACHKDKTNEPMSPRFTPWSTFTPTPTPALETPTPALAQSSAPQPTPSPTPISSPTPTSQHPQEVNGMPFADFIIMDEGVKAHVREIYSNGLELGRDPHAFSKLGDSLIANSHFLRVFDLMEPKLGTYDLGDYDYLQDTIDYYAGSFDRLGAAVRPGLNTIMVFDPKWVENEDCLPGENMMECEIRLHNPSVMIVQLGTNDRASSLEVKYDEIVRYLIEQGIVPILYTKADRGGGPNNQNNEIIRAIAQKYQVPLIDFDILAETLPDRGLKSDHTHLSVAPRFDYSDPATFRYGDAVHNLAALIMLDAVRKTIEE